MIPVRLLRRVLADVLAILLQGISSGMQFIERTPLSKAEAIFPKMEFPIPLA